MSGVKGQKSGGRNRKTLDQLVRDGTYRKDRHGHLLPTVISFPATAPPPPLPSDLVSGLGDEARAFVEELWNAYAFTPGTYPLLRLAGEQMQRRAEARVLLQDQPLIQQARNGSSVLNPAVRLERNATKMIADLLRQLDLER